MTEAKNLRLAVGTRWKNPWTGKRCRVVELSTTKVVAEDEDGIQIERDISAFMKNHVSDDEPS